MCEVCGVCYGELPWKMGEKITKTFFSDIKYIFSISGENIVIESTFGLTIVSLNK